jgi:D-sedoheptulose 7-phosphate isomerase
MQSLKRYIVDLQATLDLLPIELVDKLVSILQEARVNRRQVFIMGNGGSASTASHFVADLAKNTRYKTLPDFRVLGLTDNMAIFSAYANDEGYENVFAQQLASFVRPYDVVIAISASGNSKNVVQAIKLAKQVKARTIGLTGFDGGLLGSMVNVHINIPSNIIEQVEDIHLVIEHMVVKTLREMAKGMETPQHPLSQNLAVLQEEYQEIIG